MAPEGKARMSTNKPYRIVVGIDYSSTSELALTRAFELAAERAGSEIHAVHVVQLLVDPGVDTASIAAGLTVPEAFTRLTEHVAKRVIEWEKATNQKVGQCFPHVRLESPASELAQIAADLEAALIVVGTHGRRGIERFFLGSVAERVLRIAPCSVYVVRPHESAPVPEIAPPCPRCVETRKATGGKELWCEQHSERHGQRHTYHYESRVGQPTNMPLTVRM